MTTIFTYLIYFCKVIGFREIIETINPETRKFLSGVFLTDFPQNCLKMQLLQAPLRNTVAQLHFQHFDKDTYIFTNANPTQTRLLLLIRILTILSLSI